MSNGKHGSGSGSTGGKGGGNKPPVTPPPAPTGPVLTPQQRQKLVVLDVLQETRRNADFAQKVTDVLNGLGTSSALTATQIKIVADVSKEMTADPSFVPMALAEINGPPAPKPLPAPTPSAGGSSSGSTGGSTGSSGGSTTPSGTGTSGSGSSAPATPIIPPGSTIVEWKRVKFWMKVVLVTFLISIGLTILGVKVLWPTTVEHFSEIPAQLTKTQRELDSERQARNTDRQAHEQALGQLNSRHTAEVAELNSMIVALRQHVARLTVDSNVVQVTAAKRQRETAMEQRADALRQLEQLRTEHALAIADLERRSRESIAAVTSSKDEALASRDQVIYNLRRENELLANRTGGARIGNDVTLAVVCPNTPTGEQFEFVLERVGHEPIRFTTTVNTDNRGDHLDVQRVITVPSDTYTVSRFKNGVLQGRPFPTDLRPGPRSRWLRIQNESVVDDKGTPDTSDDVTLALWREVTMDNPFLLCWYGNVQCQLTRPEGNVRVIPYDRSVTVTSR